MASLRALTALAMSAAAPAFAQPASLPAGMAAAPPDPLGDIARRQLTDEENCQRGTADSVVVCGRLLRGGGGYRVIWAPEPGARVRLVAGEAPSAMAAMGADRCLRLCLQPVGINLLDPGSVVRGIDRVLSGN